MLTFLRNLVELFLNIPDYILFAIESFINLFLESIDAIFVIATALIPLPSEPAPPEFISQINWFFSIGALITIATPILTGYIAFLAVRWILQKVGEL